MCRYCNTITMHHVIEGQASICVESLYGFLNGRPNLKPYWLRNGKLPFRNRKGCRNGRNSDINLQEKQAVKQRLLYSKKRRRL